MQDYVPKDHLSRLIVALVREELDLLLQLAEKAGLVKLGHVALDGTKIKANASKHKAMSYARMRKREAELKAEVDRWLKAAEAKSGGSPATIIMKSARSTAALAIRREE